MPSEMNLNRLKIPEHAPSAGGKWWKIGLLCIICLAIGFAASHGWNRFMPAGALKVDTILIQPQGVSQGRGFTAGGWIEVATPQWPLIVSARISERLDTLTVKQGQTLKNGQTIATLYDKDIRTRLALGRAEVQAAQKALDKLNAGHRKEDIVAAEARLDEAVEIERIAKANYERSKALPDGAISAEALDNDLSTFKKATAVSAQLRAESDKMKAGYRLEDIAVGKAKLLAAQSRVELTERELSYCTISAPESQRPLRVLRVMHRIGEWINASKAPELISLYDPQEMQARVDVTQANISAIRVGKPVVVVTEANPDRRYSGTVLRAEPLAELSKNTVTVRVKINDPDAMLFPEMVARITFLSDAPTTAPADRTIMIPTTALLSDNVNSYVLLMDAARVRRQNVTTGLQIGAQTQITGGLKPGQRIITSRLASLRPGMAVQEN
ncbi:MAG: efflux RND transporter periplasmic adaptor subunit [Phycisphaerales bacterium]|jgi:RND family efflux transporter MFP subunit|nr:efflux RND transporter periplasmic adaptor subunit [Phycisphaerales bacterium]